MIESEERVLPAQQKRVPCQIKERAFDTDSGSSKENETSLATATLRLEQRRERVMKAGRSATADPSAQTEDLTSHKGAPVIVKTDNGNVPDDCNLFEGGSLGVPFNLPYKSAVLKPLALGSWRNEDKRTR